MPVSAAMIIRCGHQHLGLIRSLVPEAGSNGTVASAGYSASTVRRVLLLDGNGRFREVTEGHEAHAI